MDVLQVLSVVGAVALAAMAVPFLVRPRLAEKLGVTALNGNGWLEVRGIYGGLLIALAAVCLAAREPYAFLTAGVALLAFAAVGFAIHRGGPSACPAERRREWRPHTARPAVAGRILGLVIGNGVAAACRGGSMMSQTYDVVMAGYQSTDAARRRLRCARQAPSGRSRSAAKE